MSISTCTPNVAASGRYYDYGELLAPASIARLMYGTAGTTLDIMANGDRTVRAGSSASPCGIAISTSGLSEQRGAAMGMASGSTMYLVWQQNRDAVTRWARASDWEMCSDQSEHGEQTSSW